MQAAISANTASALIAIHKSHPANYASVDCALCLANAAYHIQQEDKHAARSKEILTNVPLQTINDAIREVSTALDDHELVRPLAGGLKA
jgi:hypothetical protein